MTEAVPKQKVSLSLDAELVAEFEKSGPLSPQVNAALRVEFDRRRRQLALDALAQDLKETYGSFDTPEDQAAIQRYIELLS